MHHEAGFHRGWLLHVAGGVPFDAFGALNDFQSHGRREFDRDRLIVDVDDFDLTVGGEVVFCIADELGAEFDGFVGFGIHERKNVAVDVAEFERFALGLQYFHAFGRGKALI